MSASYITIKDAAGVDKNIRTQLASGAHAAARVLYTDDGANPVDTDSLYRLAVVPPARVTVEVTPTVDTAGAYAAGDCIGGKLTFSSAANRSGGGGVIRSVIVTDLADQKADIDLLLFDSDPSNGTYTDQAAVDVDDADIVKVIGQISVATANYKSFADSAAAALAGVDAAFQLSGSANLYGLLVCRGTPTYVSTSDLTIRLVIEQD